MQLAGFRLTLHKWPVIMTLVTLLILTSLGFWQLSRAELKLSIQTLLFERLSQPEQALTPSLLDEDVRFRKVAATGKFVSQRQYLLDNRLHKGQPGYWVITPFTLANGSTILINRGWVAQGQDRSILPKLDVRKAKIIVHGTLSEQPGKLFELKDIAVANDAPWPRVIRNIDVKTISNQLGRPVSRYMLHLNAEEELVYLQNWTPVAVGPEKSRGYAVQWFSMAFVVLLIFIGLNCRRIESDPVQDRVR